MSDIPQPSDVEHVGLDLPEMNHRLYEASYEMDKAHRINHSEQPHDWRFCSAEPCYSVYRLVAEVETSIEEHKKS